MAINQINTANFDYAMMLSVINLSYKGKADITLSAYSTTAAPDVKVGSVFEDNGAIFIVDTSDITPTGYAGITNSTTFYLYYDESASVFIYSNTAPTWSDVLQGWYNSNDRAFFSMFKDSGGTLYENKRLLLSQNNFNMPNDLNVENDLTVQNDLTIIDNIIFPAYGNIGTLVLAGSTAHSTSTEYLPGTTVNGNTLIVSSEAGATYGQPLSGYNNISQSVLSIGSNQSLSLTGTWRLLARVARGSAAWYPIGLFKRIA